MKVEGGEINPKRKEEPFADLIYSEFFKLIHLQLNLIKKERGSLLQFSREKGKKLNQLTLSSVSARGIQIQIFLSATPSALWLLAACILCVSKRTFGFN